jgi:hypothetical protein
MKVILKVLVLFFFYLELLALIAPLQLYRSLGLLREHNGKMRLIYLAYRFLLSDDLSSLQVPSRGMREVP